MEKDFLIYDLETFGIDRDKNQIAQFACRRYSYNLEPLDEGTVLYCKPSDDFIIDPGAVATNGLNPYELKKTALCESEFARKISSIFNEKFYSTLILGYNNVSFDNEFINRLFYRNFIDPYSVFTNRTADVLTLLRAVHSLKRDCLKYIQVEATNRNADGSVKFRDSLKLEHMAKANNLEQPKAHDAMGDVIATANVLRLLKEKAEDIFLRYLSFSSKVSCYSMLSSAGNTEEGIAFVTSYPLYKDSYSSLYFPIISSGNDFLSFNLLCPEEEFQEKLVELEKLKNLNNVDFLNYLNDWNYTKREDKKFNLTSNLKANRVPFLYSAEEFYEKNEPELREIVGNRIKQLKSALNRSFSNVPYQKPKNKKEDVQPFPEERIFDGFLSNSRECKNLMSIVSRDDKAELRTVVKSINTKNFRDDNTGADMNYVKLLFSHYVARNFPEIFKENELKDWDKVVKTKLERDKDVFLEQVKGAREKIKEIDDKDKIRAVEETIKYEEGIFDKFSVQLF